MTVPELLIALLVMTLVTYAAYSAFEFGIWQYKYSDSRAFAQQQSRSAIDLVSRYSRMTQTIVNGAGDDLAIRVDADDDGAWETVHFFRSGQTLWMDYTDNGVVRHQDLADSVVNADLFSYMDVGGNAIANQYDRPTKTRQIGVKLIIDSDENAPPEAIVQSTQVELRNLQ